MKGRVRELDKLGLGPVLNGPLFNVARGIDWECVIYSFLILFSGKRGVKIVFMFYNKVSCSH